MSIVTIISDFGQKDHYAALLKGAILTNNPSINIIDITHEVDTHDIRQASYHLNAVCKKFPPGTIHVVAVNNFYDTDYEIIVFEYKEMFFVGPNNGLFSLAFDSIEEDQVYKVALDEQDNSMFDLIAHGVGLISHDMSITEVGPPLNRFEKKIDVKPVMTSDEIRGTIIHIDKFENVIVNVHREFFDHFRKGRDFEIFFKYYDPITKISDNYSNAAVGEVLCIFNSANYLEISINMGKAASQLDLMKDETIQIKFL
jgi:S-adenosylmethionine hydrolase